MPTIQIKSAINISDDVKELIKVDLGKAIEAIPGKSEGWLMVLFGHCQDLYFRGEKNNQAALVEVGIKGSAAKENFAKLGELITQSLTKHTDLEADGIYISFTEFENYMWNSMML